VIRNCGPVDVRPEVVECDPENSTYYHTTFRLNFITPTRAPVGSARTPAPAAAPTPKPTPDPMEYTEYTKMTTAAKGEKTTTAKGNKKKMMKKKSTKG
jgi:hypothetical protein